MKKDRILATIIAGLILTNLAACGKYEPAATADTTVTAPTVSTAADVPSATNPSDDIPAGTAPPATDGMETTAEKEEITSPPQSAATAPTEPAEPQPTKPTEQKPCDTTQPPVTDPPATEPPVTEPPKVEPTTAPTEPVETQPPATEPPTAPPATEPPPTDPPVTEPVPTEPPPTEPPATEPTPTEPEFDVGYWVSFAKSYAQSIGLELDSEAVYCWDNPTIASANSRYLERDLKGLLDKYSRDEDITAVWVWASQRTESSWDIYIGYA